MKRTQKNLALSYTVLLISNYLSFLFLKLLFPITKDTFYQFKRKKLENSPASYYFGQPIYWYTKITNRTNSTFTTHNTRFMRSNVFCKQLTAISFIMVLTTMLSGQAPSSILPDLVNFKIQYPLDENGDDYTGVAYEDRDNPHIESETELNLSGYTAPALYEDYFYVSGNEVVFKAHCAGALTSINAYPRSELRETPNGTNDLWNFADEHELSATFRVTHLPDLKPEVCMLQIKGNTSNSTSNTEEAFRLEYRDDSQGLHIAVNENTTINHIMDYSVGETIEANLYVNNGEITINLTNTSTGDTYTHQYTGAYDWGYFKAGCYTQSSIWEEKNNVGNELPTAYGEVRFSSLVLGPTCTPMPLGNLSATNITPNSAVLTWDFDSAIDHYNVRYRPEGSSTWAFHTGLRLSQGEFTVANSIAMFDLLALYDETEYEWQVRAKCADGSATDYNDGQGPNFTTPMLGALSVELVNLIGNFEKRNKEVALSWKTASESNNKGFQIERALNPNDGFEVIGWVDGAGNADLMNDYRFEDIAIQLGQTYYYRLKQVDLNGRAEFSNIIAVQAGIQAEYWTVFPNPMQGQFTISPNQLIQELIGVVQLIDINGSVVFEAARLFQQKEGVVLDLGDLAAGVYALVVRDGEGEILVSKRVVCE